MSDLVGFEQPKMDWKHGPDLFTRFKRFRQKCELLFEGPLKSRDEEQKCKYLLLWSGDYGLDLFNTWNFTPEKQKNLSEYWNEFEKHVKPQANHILNRYYLRGLKQNNRNLDEFLTEARLLVQNSGYNADMLDELMRDTLVFGVDSDTVRRKCIAEGNGLTYEKAKQIARTEEATRMQIKFMNEPLIPNQVDALKHKKRPEQNRPPRTPNHKTYKYKGNKDGNKTPERCPRCGNQAHNTDQRCPARGEKCYNCGKQNHFSTVCRAKNANVNAGVNALQGDQSSDTSSEYSDLSDKFYLGTIEVEHNDTVDNQVNSMEKKEKILVNMKVTAKPHHKRTTPVVCKVDTGAEVNVISKYDYDRIITNPKERDISTTQYKITAYGGQEIKTLGTCKLYLHHRNSVREVEFSITQVPGPAMLGCKTCVDLDLVKVNCGLERLETRTSSQRLQQGKADTSNQLNSQPQTPLSKEKIISDYGDCFEGLGTFNMKPYHITLDPQATPVIHPPRTVPVHVHEMYKKELKKMEELGVITPVNEPTEWVNSIVISQSTNDKGEITKLRVCLDPRDLNKYVKREHHYTRTVDEVVAQLHNAKYFSIVDVKSGYWHVPLDEPSSFLTTFNTPFGRYRFNRLPFGLIVSQDVFQRNLDSALEGLEGVTGIADDTFVFASTEKEHDEIIISLLNRARERGIRFNKDKLQLKCQEVSFFGHTWTPNGIKPDRKKVSAILDMKPPTNIKDLQSFLGLVNYLTRYSGKLATITAPLRELTKKEIAYIWGYEQDRAFIKVKEEMCSLNVLRYFDPKAPSVVQTDASLKGLGAVLLQNGQPVLYASKALTETERNYSNIEREALGVVWGLERFHYFIYGKHCTVETDHKPLESIFKKKLSTCPPRLQRFVLRALTYDVTVKYVKGSDVPIADALSRISPQPDPSSDQLPQLDVHLVTKTLPASPTKIQQIREETAKDQTLSLLKDTIYEGWPDNRINCPNLLLEYWNFREELTIEDGIILKADRIIIPTSLRPEILTTVHQGHMGQEKCLLRARTAVFWPGITKEITDLVQKCEPCQRHQRKLHKEPILQPEIPCRPWEQLSSDLLEYKQRHYLLLTDKYSRFPVVRLLSSTKSVAIINQLKSVFSEHGIPDQLSTDNGPQYDSKEFKDFMKSYGIEHITSSPRYPQSNGFAERAVQIVKNILKKCEESGEDPYLGMLSYRATPLDHQLKSPAELLTRRRFKTTLPMAQRSLLTGHDRETIKEKMYERQGKQAYYYNLTAGKPHKPLSEGQHIRMYNHDSQTWIPGTVTQPSKEPRSYIVKSDKTGNTYRRTRQQLMPDLAVPKDKQLENEVVTGRAAEACADTQEITHPEITTQGLQDHYVTRSGRSVKPREMLDL